jgi:hypothetical protein
MNKQTETHKKIFDEYKEIIVVFDVYKRRPRRPPFRRVLSDGIGVTSSTIEIINLIK